MFLTLMLLMLPVLLLADDSQIITLKDGSQIRGEITSFASGVYTVNTPALGYIKISSSQVANIANNKIAPGQNSTGTLQASSNEDINQRVQTTQTQVMNDPRMMSEITDMMKDPEIVQLLSDPDLAKKFMSRDVKAIQNDPKAQKLMNNPKIQAIMEQLRHNSSTQQ